MKTYLNKISIVIHNMMTKSIITTWATKKIFSSKTHNDIKLIYKSHFDSEQLKVRSL
jgi:hypothetical protein